MVLDAILWPFLVLLFLLLLLLILLIGLFIQQYAMDAAYRTQENKLQEEADEDPSNIRKAWRADRQFMHNYLSRNLGQNRQIFWTSLVMIPIGFAVIVVGSIVSIIGTPRSGENIASSIGVLSLPEWIIITGLITEFLAATILFIYKSTFSQTSRYFRELARLNIVGIAAQMVDTINDDDGSARNQAIKESAVALLQRFSYSEEMESEE